MANLYLIVPGMGSSGEDHWQSRWERAFPDRFRRIQQEQWQEPDCGDWIAKIESDVQAAGPEDVVLVAHSLGCTAVVQWAGKYRTDIKGAMLVAPSDCETEKYHSTFRTSGFEPMPLDHLPFKAIVITSTNDEWVSLDRAAFFSESWGAHLVKVGEKGHINVASGFGDWDEGLELLRHFGEEDLV